MKYCARHDHNHYERTCPFCEDESERIGDAVVGEDIFAADDDICAYCGFNYDDCQCVFDDPEEDDTDMGELDFDDPDRDLRFQEEDEI